MLASDVLTLGAAIFGLVTSVLGSSVCYYNSTRTSKINLSILKVKVHNLENLIDRLQQKLNGIDVLTPDPSPWIAQAKVFLSKVHISDLESRLTENCANGGACNFWCRCGAARLVEEKIEAVDMVLENGKLILHEIKVKGSKQPEVNIAGSSREVIKQKIWQQVSQEKGAGVVCIHGVAGVGKTAMAVAIHNQALTELKNFENVIWVNIEYGSGLKRVQEEIADKLSVDLSLANNGERAKLLWSALMQKKRFLLVLDSMWQVFSLNDIGIPEPTGGCKVIVTSRIHSVCRKFTRKLKSKEFYEIQPLCDVEAWELFKGEIGPNLVNLERETLKMAQLAVEDLDGLPLAIKMLAESLAEIHDDFPKGIDATWKEEFHEIGQSTSILGSRSQELFDCFKCSFENLGEIPLSCFIYCTLFPKGHFIKTKELIEYWLSEGLLGEVSSLEESMSKGRKILNELKDAHLLEHVYETGREEAVKILNVVRLVAMDLIVKSSHHFLINCGGSLSELPLATDWPKEVERASFMQNQLRALVSNPNCKKLSTLLLQENPLRSDHHAKFFSKMPNLKVLDLSHTGISSLPKSLSTLKNLRALLLRNCPNLKSLPTLSNLQNLIVMDLSGTPLEQLPEGMSYMTNLRRLDLSETRLEVFPAKVVSKLTQIEELLLIPHDDGGYMWGSSQVIPQLAGASVEELVDLRRLAILHLAFINAKVFEKYVNETEQSSHAPRSFRYYVGGLFDGHTVGDNSVVVIGDYNVRLPERTLELHLMMCSEAIASIRLDGRLRDLRVVDVSDFDEMSYLFTTEMLVCLRNLRKICVKRCKSMQGIIQPGNEVSTTSVTLPELTVFVLFDLPKLESICNGEVLNCPSLRGFKVWNCDNLKLPEVLLGRTHGVTEIKGDSKWVAKGKAYSRSLSSVFKINEAPVPPKLSSTPRVRRHEPGPRSIKRRTLGRSLVLPAFSLTRPDSRNETMTNQAVTSNSAISRLMNIVTRGTASSRSSDRFEDFASPHTEDGESQNGFVSNSSRSL